eukprot:NODE_113_length_18482_cov_1.630746.p19 type:complete len:109 gc:universal NODE_113_length_18482_cov_1.630746:9657-9983(+)
MHQEYRLAEVPSDWYQMRQSSPPQSEKLYPYLPKNWAVLPFQNLFEAHQIRCLLLERHLTLLTLEIVSIFHLDSKSLLYSFRWCIVENPSKSNFEYCFRPCDPDQCKI